MSGTDPSVPCTRKNDMRVVRAIIVRSTDCCLPYYCCCCCCCCCTLRDFSDKEQYNSSVIITVNRKGSSAPPCGCVQSYLLATPSCHDTTRVRT